MSHSKDLNIDVAEHFPHLPAAPIVEAVIDLRAKAEVPWEEDAIRTHLDARLTGYDFLDSQKEIQHQIKVEPGKIPHQEIRDLGWKGLRYRSKDGFNIAQFKRDGFAFSRLRPYEKWDPFKNEAMRLWDIFLGIAKSTQIQRIGLRFVNRIEISTVEQPVSDYITGAPTAPKSLNLSFHNFMHHDTWSVPKRPYAINVIRAFQALPNQTPAIILDIDVFTITPPELQPELLQKQILEMRWLKNKTFFGSVTPRALKLFQK